MSKLVNAKDVSMIYKTDAGDFYAVNHVNMGIEKGSLTILRGRSGSGKTTMLNMLSTLDSPSEGSIFFEETEISKMTERKRELFRRKNVGYVFQAVALLPMMNAYENVEFALRLSHYRGNRKERIEEVLHKVGLSKRMYHMPYEMSGGEQQRVAIARALAPRPRIIFADEPTAELDTATSFKVVKIFKDQISEEGVTIVMTTHDSRLFDVGDTCYEMEDGQIVGNHDTV